MDAIANIRVDAETDQGSVVDVIRAVNSDLLASSDAETVVKDLTRDVTDLVIAFDTIRIDGGGEPTPVADARTLVEIVWLLPGTAPRGFRRETATLVCRALGEDVSLVDEIEARVDAWREDPVARRFEQDMPPLVSWAMEVRHRLAVACGGVTEQDTPDGRADVVTPFEVIEIEHHLHWNRALGRVLAHGDSMEDKKKRIHLFGGDGDGAAARLACERARAVCGKYGVAVTSEPPAKRTRMM